jgi:hypothetical protein
MAPTRKLTSASRSAPQEIAVALDFHLRSQKTNRPGTASDPQTTVGILWETWFNNVRNAEQNEQMKKLPSVRAIVCKVLKLCRLRVEMGP